MSFDSDADVLHSNVGRILHANIDPRGRFWTCGGYLDLVYSVRRHCSQRRRQLLATVFIGNYWSCSLLNNS